MTSPWTAIWAGVKQCSGFLLTFLQLGYWVIVEDLLVLNCSAAGTPPEKLDFSHSLICGMYCPWLVDSHGKTSSGDIIYREVKHVPMFSIIGNSSSRKWP